MKASLRKKFKGQTCLVCQNPEIDLCHVKSKGSGGPDEVFNLMALCRNHHSEQHRMGIVSFFWNYPRVQGYLLASEWRVEEIVGKEVLLHPRLEAIYDPV